jgi:hypothetical protein
MYTTQTAMHQNAHDLQIALKQYKGNKKVDLAIDDLVFPYQDAIDRAESLLKKLDNKNPEITKIKKIRQDHRLLFKRSK